MKHFHPDDELAIRLLNCFETTTAALDVQGSHNDFIDFTEMLSHHGLAPPSH
jgi:hypothetical protein